MRWEPGMKVVHRAQRAWGVGVVVQVADEGRRLAVRFAGRDGITVVSGRDPALHAVPKETPIEEPQGGPLDQLDHAPTIPCYGGKLGIDATHKGPAEGTREWPGEIQMSDEIRARVDARWADLGIRLGGRTADAS